MKFLNIIFLLSTATASIASADTYVNGYYRKNGTYVQPHHRSDSNHTKTDNWSTRGNVNPYTGQSGTKNIYDTGNSYNGGSNYNSNSYDDED